MSKIFVSKIRAAHPYLSKVIQFSVGCPTDDKICNIISSYKDIDNVLYGAYEDEHLIGVLGIQHALQKVVIRHISVLPKFRSCGVGTLLLNHIKVKYNGCKITAETDEESVGFYRKSGFTYNPFQGKHGHLRSSLRAYQLES